LIKTQLEGEISDTVNLGVHEKLSLVILWNRNDDTESFMKQGSAQNCCSGGFEQKITRVVHSFAFQDPGSAGSQWNENKS
jgi:hypothetical protein